MSSYYVIYLSLYFNLSCALNLSSQRSLMIFVCVTTNILTIDKCNAKFQWLEGSGRLHGLEVTIEDWLNLPSQDKRKGRDRWEFGANSPCDRVRGSEAKSDLVRSLDTSCGIKKPWKVTGRLAREGGILSDTSLGQEEREKRLQIPILVVAMQRGVESAHSSVQHIFTELLLSTR